MRKGIFQVEQSVKLNPVVYSTDARPVYSTDPKTLNKINSFTNNSTINKYLERNPDADETKVRKDIFLGKEGEVGGVQYFNDTYGINVDADFNIYDVKDKSFDLDLSGIIHVKSCPLERESWTFQFRDRFNPNKGKDPILKNPDSPEWLLLTEVDSENHNVFIRALLQWKNISDLTTYPLKRDLRKIKRCIYLDDIIWRAKEKGWFTSLKSEAPSLSAHP